MATNADLIHALKDWKEEILEVTNDYRDSIARLNKIESNYRSNKWEVLKSYLPPLAQIITVIAIVGFLLYFSTKVECGVTIKFIGAEISRVCK